MLLRQSLSFGFTYWLASDLICLLVLRLWQPADRDETRDIFFLTRGSGPIVISWLLYHLFLLLPQRQPATYIVAILCLFAAALVLGRGEIRRLAGVYVDLYRAMQRRWPTAPLTLTLLGLIAGVAALILVIGVAFPIIEGDALGFTMEARLIFRDLSFAHYPTLAADPQTGYFYDTFQVPCLQMLYVWFFLTTGTSQLDILARTVAPLYALYGVLLLCWVLFRYTRSGQAALWGGLALIATPVFTSESYLNTQDPHRLYFSFCALILLEGYLRARTRARGLLLVACLGLAVYSHFFGLLTLLAVVLLYACFAHGSLRRRLASACFVGMVALTLGAASHYARPPVALRVLNQFPPLDQYLGPFLTDVDLHEDHAADHAKAEQQAHEWLAARRGQAGWLKEFIFGKLQILTGVEWFGAVVWVFLASVVLWLRQPQKPLLEKILMATAAIYAGAVLSDLRAMASSNPRYIATALPICAYFIGRFALPVLAGVRQRWGMAASRLGAGLGVLALIAPLLAITAIRGAKVGLTNPGDLYVRLHDMSWIAAVARHPLHAAAVTWNRYLGIKDTLQYFWASDDIKLVHSHDSFAAIAYMNSSTPPAATALVFRVTRYFYYARRRGLSYLDPRMKEFEDSVGTDYTCRLLASLGADYVLFDSYYEGHPTYASTELIHILSDPRLSTKVYEYGSAKVYQLHCQPS